MSVGIDVSLRPRHKLPPEKGEKIVWRWQLSAGNLFQTDCTPCELHHTCLHFTTRGSKRLFFLYLFFYSFLFYLLENLWESSPSMVDSQEEGGGPSSTVFRVPTLRSITNDLRKTLTISWVLYKNPIAMDNMIGSFFFSRFHFSFSNLACRNPDMLSVPQTLPGCRSLLGLPAECIAAYCA